MRIDLRRFEAMPIFHKLDHSARSLESVTLENVKSVNGILPSLPFFRAGAIRHGDFQGLEVTYRVENLRCLGTLWSMNTYAFSFSRSRISFVVLRVERYFSQRKNTRGSVKKAEKAASGWRSPKSGCDCMKPRLTTLLPLLLEGPKIRWWRIFRGLPGDPSQIIIWVSLQEAFSCYSICSPPIRRTPKSSCSGTSVYLRRYSYIIVLFLRRWGLTPA